MALTHDSNANVWRFETDQMSGCIDPNGERHGVKELLHKPTSTQVVHPKYDLLNMFLLFSTNHNMGQLRTQERTIEADGSRISVHFPATDVHKVDITAVYEVKEPNLIDLSITAQSNWPYSGYEVFLSNYFDLALGPHVFVQGNPFDVPKDTARWIAPEVNDVFVGTGLVFPRDQHAARLSTDGRWERIWGLYQWNPQRYFELPVVMSANPEKGVAGVLMSRPEDCYAVISGYESTNMDDPFKDQNPLYFSLFGDNIRVGDERTVEVRFAATELDNSFSQVLKLYDDFISDKG